MGKKNQESSLKWLPLIAGFMMLILVALLSLSSCGINSKQANLDLVAKKQEAATKLYPNEHDIYIVVFGNTLSEDVAPRFGHGLTYVDIAEASKLECPVYRSMGMKWPLYLIPSCHNIKPGDCIKIPVQQVENREAIIAEGRTIYYNDGLRVRGDQKTGRLYFSGSDMSMDDLKACGFGE